MPSHGRSPAGVPKATSKLGRYEIVGRLATGGMATVYLARLEGAGGFAREFALKVVHPHLTDDPGFHRRFFAEATVASRVRHPNAVTTIDAGEDRGYSYLVLELIDGVTLRQLLLHRSRPLPAPEAAEAVVMVARGLHALHTVADEDGAPMGVVHRDLSPQNVMIDRSGRAVLIDLGLAKVEHDGEATQVGVLVGKLPYMSPEQARIDPLDARSDVFALGTVLFELCTGALPFGDAHTTSTLEKLQACDHEILAAELETHEIPLWLGSVILTCLCARPSDRFDSALALAEALSMELQRAGHDEAVLRGRLGELASLCGPDMVTVQPAELPPRIQPAPQSTRPMRWAALGAAMVLATALGVHFAGSLGTRTATQQREPDQQPSLASDAAEPRPVPEASISTKKADEGSPAVDAAVTGAPIPTEADAESSAEPSTRPGSRSKRRRRRTAELKPNPYGRR